MTCIHLASPSELSRKSGSIGIALAMTPPSNTSSSDLRSIITYCSGDAVDAVDVAAAEEEEEEEDNEEEEEDDDEDRVEEEEEEEEDNGSPDSSGER